jgi:hypothetical protein
MEVYVDDEAKLTLHGLQQHYVKLKDAEKNRKLFELLDVLEFNQVSACILMLWVFLKVLKSRLLGKKPKGLLTENLNILKQNFTSLHQD